MDILTGRGFGFWIKLLCSVQCSALKYKTVKLFAALGGGSVLGNEHHQLNTEKCTAGLSAVLVEISFLERSLWQWSLRWLHCWTTIVMVTFCSNRHMMTLAMMVMICPTIVSQTSNSSSSGSRWARGEPKKRKIILIRPGEIDPYGGAIPISNGIVLWKDEEDDEYGEVGEMQCSTVCNARFQQIRILFLLHPQHQQSGCWH